MTPTPHILERGARRELFTQNGFRWVCFEETGYTRIDPMPGLDDSIAAQKGNGSGYIETYRKKLNSKLRRSLRRAKYLKKRMTGTRLLDVGSNIGCFVASADKIGLDASGVELNPDLVAEARRLFPACNFTQSPIEYYQQLGEKFDGIYCSEVIEHVPDPFAFTRKLYTLLNDKGVLFLTTPAIEEYIQGGRPVRDLGAPDHKLYFSKKNIREFMLAAGFHAMQHKYSLGRGIQIICRK